MTVGAAVLNLAEPQHARSVFASSAPSEPAALDRIVSDLAVADVHSWQSIVIHYSERQPWESSARLAAVGNSIRRVGYHFRVDPDGTVIATARWRRQEPIAEEPEGVHICFSRGRGPTVLPRAQWEAFRALLAYLRDHWQLELGRVRLAKASDIACRPDLPRQAASLRDMLVSTGLIR